MRPSFELIVAALALPMISAFPQNEARSYLVDQCKKAVSRTRGIEGLLLTFDGQVFDGPSRPPPHIPRKEAAKADCASYLRRTVSPCPVYVLTSNLERRF
jgi:hypothetical protein